MRVFLVTFTEYLPVALTQVLNPALEYCAIVVDEPDIAKNMLKNVPPLRDKIFPFYELKECAENNYFDIALFISDGRINGALIPNFIKYGIPQNKIFNLHISQGGSYNHVVEKTLRFYKEHAKEFEMFATGISYTSVALDANKFKHKIFNFGRSSQDLYYDYQVAKFILSDTGGGGRRKY